MISVLCPTRKRVELLAKMLESCVATNHQSIEILMRCDFDDIDTLKFLQAPNSHNRVNQGAVFAGPRLEGYKSLPVFFNELATKSHGELILMINDDAEFITPGWDVKLAEEAAKYPDGIFNLGVDTVYNAQNFVFPCISRKMYQILGKIHDERLIYSDLWLRDVAKTFNRAIYMPEVKISHKWVGLGTPDKTRIEAQKCEGEALGVGGVGYWKLHDQCVQEAVEKIKNGGNIS